MKIRSKGRVRKGTGNCLEQRNIAHSFGALNETSGLIFRYAISFDFLKEKKYIYFST